jgi:hypothetical protein
MQMFLLKLHIQNATSPTCTAPKLMLVRKKYLAPGLPG